MDFWPNKPFTRFIDTFYGGGSISHWVLEKYPDVEFVINDQNSELIQMYEVIRDNYDDFMTEVQHLERGHLALTTQYKNTEQYNTTKQYKDRHAYYTSKKMAYINDWQNMGRIRESAHLYYLMKTSFNGWWKIYNYSNGRYATPPGLLKEKENFIDPVLVKQHSEFFKNKCIILNGDFEVVKPYVNDNSYVYFDPPYRDSTTIYTSDGFNDAEQVRLCNFFKYCSSVGARVGLSNKEIGDGFFQNHLGQYDIKIYSVLYTAGQGTTTNTVQECFVRNFKSL
jgi:DNA adenine methylase